MSENEILKASQNFLSNQAVKSYIALGLAIILVVFIVLAYIFYPRPDDNYYSKYVHPYPNEVIDVTFWELYYTDMKLQGFQAYEEGNYNFAIEMFDRHLDENYDDGIVRFYAGESYMVLHKPKKALQHYNLALKSGANTYTSVIEWHKAVCYLMIDENSPKLKVILEKIMKNENHPYFEPAAEIYQTIFV